MALADLQAYIVQRLQQVDNTLDLTPGSPYDVQVIQPILRRLGPDPFTVDIGVFIQTLLNQQFPDLPTKEGDAITDLLIKTAIVLWNPLVREITRVTNNLSFRDPTILTTAEAEALGANLFATRTTGDKSVGTARVYFAQPQNSSVSPSNFVTSKTGLHFFPTEVQSIRVEEMMLNLEGSLYYFDVHIVAEAAGDQYNIGPDELSLIANMPSAVRITNKVRFRSGTPDEDAVSFIGRIEQDLTERSLVTLPGAVAKISKEFPEVTRMNVVGFNDAEMQRDVLTGGGLGALLASGVSAASDADGEGHVLTRRVIVEAGTDFTAIIGPAGASVSGYVLTLANAYPTYSLPRVRDLNVREVIDALTLDLEEQVLKYAATGAVWTLRKKTLQLSDIPGGIIYPDGPDGTVSIPDNQVHVGGATDVYVRGTNFDTASLLIDSISDDQALLMGVDLETITQATVILSNLVLGTDYSIGDATYLALQAANDQHLSIQILDPPNAGSYRILSVQQTTNSPPTLTLTPSITVVTTAPATKFRWRISEDIYIDLVEPKETRISGSDLRTVQGLSYVDTLSGVDFGDYGVSANDILRINTGSLIIGDYKVLSVTAPFFTQVNVDRPLPATVTGAQYTIFRLNAGGGATRPFIRVDTIDLLDTTGQPVGTTIPYANPVDIQTMGFANAAHGIKADFTDGKLGIVSLEFVSGNVNLYGLNLSITWDGFNYGGPGFTVLFTDANPISLTLVVAAINAAVASITSNHITRIATLLDGGKRIGILPVMPNTQVGVQGLPSTGQITLFGAHAGGTLSTRDVTSDEVYALGGWGTLRPALDYHFDVAQVVDGLQIGFYSEITLPNLPFVDGQWDPIHTTHDFLPEARRHIQVGARSLGTARLYFLEPTSAELDHNTRFTLERSDGSLLRFIPDPTNNYQRVPALPGGTKPVDGVMNTSGAFSSVSVDFVVQGIEPDDLLEIDYAPLVGTIALADPPAGSLHAKSIILSLGGGSDKTIIFMHDSGSNPAADVTRQGIVTQINQAVGQVIASLDSTYHLVFNPDLSVVVRPGGTSNAYLGFSTTASQSNDSTLKGTYTITNVAASTLTVSPTVPTGGTAQQYKIFRAGVQRIVSTDMAKNLGTAGFYYFDAELISEGTGDQYNVAADLQMTVTGHRSDGYYLTTTDSDLSFSPAEILQLHLSRSILGIGVNDDPSNATQLAGQNIQVNYEYSAITGNVDSFIRSETERVINDSPLGRHLTPYFVRFDLTYTGGSKEDVLTSDIQTFIQNLYPTESLEVSDLMHLATVRGARAVDNPVDLIAVIHNIDRTVSVERSQDKINVGRLAAFIPDALLIKRRLA